MNVKYAPKFKPLFEALPLEIQRQFVFIDARVMKGDLSKLRPQGTIHVAYIGIDHGAFGKIKQNKQGQDEFYWIYVGAKQGVPVIL